jgi:betaine-aldehyde dehydrogenase
MSGIGRDLGTYGFEEYLETKQINVSLKVEPSGFFNGN